MAIGTLGASGGRLLPAFGLVVADGIEHQAFSVQRTDRSAWFDEALVVMRKCWYDDVVDHDGERFHYEGLPVRPQPKQLDVWLGGFAPSELKRVGRMADGWLPSFVTPADAASGRVLIEQVAAEHDRAIEDDHYGVLIPYAMGPVPDAFASCPARPPAPRTSTTRSVSCRSVGTPSSRPSSASSTSAPPSSSWSRSSNQVSRGTST